MNNQNDWDFEQQQSSQDDWDFEQQQSSQEANSKVTELEALRREVRELKEVINNKQQINSGDIAAGVAGGIMRVIGIFVALYLALIFIFLLGSVVISTNKDNSPSPSITLP